MLSWMPLKTCVFLPLAVFLVLIIIYANTPYGKSNVLESQIKSIPTIRVSVGEWPPDLLTYLAKEKGFFNQNGINVDIVPVTGFEDLFKKIENKELDIWTITLLDLVIADSKDKEWQAFQLQSFSDGADAILASEPLDFTELHKLKGKKIGVEKGTVGEFFLSIVLKKANLSLDDIETLDIPFDEVPYALESGQIELGVTYEPYITEALSSGANLFIDSSIEKRAVIDVYTANSTYLNENEDTIKNFMRSILQASDYLSNSPQESIKIMSSAYDVDAEKLRYSFDNLHIPNLRENQTAFTRLAAHLSIFNYAKLAEQYLEEQGLIEEQSSDLNILFRDFVWDL